MTATVLIYGLFFRISLAGLMKIGYILPERLPIERNMDLTHYKNQKMSMCLIFPFRMTEEV